MTITILSIKRAKGTYEGRDYDNTTVYGVVHNSTNESVLCGGEIELCKFKTAAFADALERNIKALDDPNIKSAKDLEGLSLSPVYNKYGGCEDFTLSLT